VRVSENIDALSNWVESFREDVETMKAILENKEVDADARKYAATSLTYLISRMDLIPDWTPTIGVADDVMVLRICVDIAGSYGLVDNLDSDTLIAVGKLTNEAERIDDLLGGDLYSKLRKIVARLSDEPVRGVTPTTIVDDQELRQRLYDDVEQELQRMPAAAFDDAESVELRLRSYLHAKLKTV
jgi:uncharacterized membrane protein YkvA (DUF1232 family)